MPAFMIVDVHVRDAAAYEDYKKGVAPLAAKHGGVYLARGGACEVLEGTWTPARLVLFSFPDRASIQAFVDDPAYRDLKALRHRVADTNIVVVEGL